MYKTKMDSSTENRLVAKGTWGGKMGEVGEGKKLVRKFGILI